MRILLLPFGRPGRGRTRPRGRAVVDKDFAFVGLAAVAVVIGRPDDDIVVAVAVHIARRGCRNAKVSTGLVALGRPRRGRTRPRGRAVVDKDRSFVGMATVIMWRPDDDIVVAVAVHIPRRPHGVAEVRTRLISLGRPGRRAHQRVHIQGIGMARVPDDEAQPLRALLQVCLYLLPPGIPHRKAAVAQHGPALMPQHRLVLAHHLQRGARLQEERPLPARPPQNRKALLQPPPAVLVPLHQSRTPVFHPAARNDRCNPAGPFHRPGPTPARKRPAPLPALFSGAWNDPDASFLKVGAEVVGPVGGLKGPVHRRNPILPLPKVGLHLRPPGGLHPQRKRRGQGRGGSRLPGPLHLRVNRHRIAGFRQPLPRHHNDQPQRLPLQPEFRLHPAAGGIVDQGPAVTDGRLPAGAEAYPLRGQLGHEVCFHLADHLQLSPGGPGLHDKDLLQPRAQGDILLPQPRPAVDHPILPNLGGYGLRRPDHPRSRTHLRQPVGEAGPLCRDEMHAPGGELRPVAPSLGHHPFPFPARVGRVVNPTYNFPHGLYMRHLLSPGPPQRPGGDELLVDVPHIVGRPGRLPHRHPVAVAIVEILRDCRPAHHPHQPVLQVVGEDLPVAPDHVAVPVVPVGVRSGLGDRVRAGGAVGIVHRGIPLDPVIDVAQGVISVPEVEPSLADLVRPGMGEPVQGVVAKLKHLPAVRIVGDAGDVPDGIVLIVQVQPLRPGGRHPNLRQPEGGSAGSPVSVIGVGRLHPVPQQETPPLPQGVVGGALNIRLHPR